jgi:DNA-binding XRE family transcriptional regulator
MSKKDNSIPEAQLIRITEISGLIRNWRINDNLSRADFSKLAEVHPNSIYNIEHERVDIITLFKCIDATGLTLSQFFEGME